jgi:hypothetical protein
MLTDDPKDPLIGFEDENRNIPNYERPPVDQPDDGMGTASEEVISAEEISPEQKDGGMSAGYPPLKDEDLLPEPAVSVVKPIPSSMRQAPLFSPDAFKFTGPNPVLDGGVYLNQNEGKKAKLEMLEILHIEEKANALWARADKAQEDVKQNITSLPTAQKMMDYIRLARNELMGGMENYEEAEHFINEVEFRLAQIKNLKSLSRGYIIGLYSYEVVWAIALLLILIYGIGVIAAFSGTKMEGIPDLTYLLSSVIWGGFGGVIGALLALVKHISIKQDFDKQHTWWYISSPTIGVGIGAVVYLFMHVGLFATIGNHGDIASPLIIYVLAWLAGYQQNIFTDLVKRMMKTLMGEGPKDDDVKKPGEK